MHHLLFNFESIAKFMQLNGYAITLPDLKKAQSLLYVGKKISKLETILYNTPP